MLLLLSDRGSSPRASWPTKVNSGGGALASSLLRRRHLEYLNSIAVGVAHEAQPRAPLAHGVGRLLGLDPLLGKPGERAVEVLGGDGDEIGRASCRERG